MKSTELNTNIGTFNAKTSCSLRAYSTDFDYYRFDGDTGEVYLPARMPRGIWNVLAEYQAGWSSDEIPEDLLNATSELVRLSYLYLQQNPNKASESIGSYSYSLAPATAYAWERLSPQARVTLGLYKSRLPAEWRMGVQV